MGPRRVRRVGQVVVTVVDTPGVEVVEVQRVTAAVAVGHAELDYGRLARADLEDFAQAIPEVGGGLIIHNDHPALGYGVAARAVNVKGGGGAAAQRKHC